MVEGLHIFVNLGKNLRKNVEYLAREDLTIPPGASSLAAAPSKQITTFCKFLAGIFSPLPFCNRFCKATFSDFEHSCQYTYFSFWLITDADADTDAADADVDVPPLKPFQNMTFDTIQTIQIRNSLRYTIREGQPGP